MSQKKKVVVFQQSWLSELQINQIEIWGNYLNIVSSGVPARGYLTTDMYKDSKYHATLNFFIYIYRWTFVIRRDKLVFGIHIGIGNVGGIGIDIGGNGGIGMLIAILIMVHQNL